MFRRGSLVEYVGSDKMFDPGKKLMIHDVKGDSVIVWTNQSGKWSKKTIKAANVKEVVI
jgi:hypothetical protein